jgi:2-methylcitrate dehydratase PrpD
MTTRSVSEDLATFVADVTFEDVPEDGVTLVEQCFADTVGVVLAGSAEGAGEIAAETAVAVAGDTGGATLLATGTTLPATEAAFANATAAHGLDYDDYTMAVPGHTSATMVPAILALAERIGATGREALTAYVAGFETQYYLGQPIKPDHYDRGWHATSTLGTFGATAAAASLLGLDASAVRHALNVAASMPAGIRRNFGSMTKPMHAGQAARSGVTAALLAERGFTAASDAIEGEYGFFDLYSGGADPDLEALPAIGDRWAIAEDGVILKKYPCCGASHTAIAAAETIADEYDLAPESIESIDVTGAERLTDILRYDDPDTGDEAKFSVHYPVASALVRGRVDLVTFEDSSVDDPVVQAVRERVSFEADPDLPYYSSAATVRVETTGGEILEQSRERRPGSPELPLSETELLEKFAHCTSGVLDEQATETTFDRFRELRRQSDVSHLVELLVDGV